MRTLAALLFTLCLLTGGLTAQTGHWWLPTGTDKLAGGSNNTIPIWTMAATYQQVHDAADIARQGKVLIMKGLSLRVSQKYSVGGRKMDCVLSLGHTKVNSQNASTTFSTNLGSSPTTVVGTKNANGTFSFTPLSIPTTKGTAAVNPASFTLTFKSNFIYIPGSGNLCWEWRLKNNTVNSFGQMDAVSWTRSTGNEGTTIAPVGTGCTAGGATSAATVTVTKRASLYRDINVILTNAPANANALLAIALAKKTTDLGWCTKLELVPTYLIPGKANGSGTWQTTVNMHSTVGLPPVTLYAQYAYNDASQGAGLGLSNLTGYTTPNITGAYGVTKIYAGPYNSTTNGNELATSGSRAINSALVCGFVR